MWETWVQTLGWEDPLEKGKAYPLQYCGLENSMECVLHRVAKSWEDPLEKAMATHSSTLVWKIPWMEEPGGLQSMGSQRVGHNRVTSLVTFNHQFLLTRRRQAFSGHPLVQWPHHIVFIHLPLGSLFLREIGKIQTFSMAIKHTPLTLLLLLLLLSHVSRVRLCATP